eukprot:c15134_g1_i1 orf=218-1030(+)
MHVMRRLKSLASTSRSSLPEPEGARINQNSSETSSQATEAAHSLRQHVLSARLQPAGGADAALECSSRFHEGSTGVDQLPKEMYEMKIQNESNNAATQDKEPSGNNKGTGHVIVTTVAGSNGQPKQTLSYVAERAVGTGSFGIVYQAKCLETGETVAIKKVLQDKRYKNRELQVMHILDHPNVVTLKHCFYSNTAEKEELYLNLVLEYVPETVYGVSKQYIQAQQRMPLIYVKLYTYQICRALAYIHNALGVCHRDIKPQNLLVNPYTQQ